MTAIGNQEMGRGWFLWPRLTVRADPSIDQKGVNTDGGQRLSVTEAGNSNSSENALQSAGSSQINDTGLGNDLSDLSNADQSHEAVSNVLAGRVSPRTHLPLTGLATRSDDRNPIKGLLSEHAANHRSPTLGPEKQRQKSVDRKDTTGQHMEPNLPRPKTSKAAEKVSPSNEQETQPTEIPHKRPRSKPSTSSRAEFDQKTDSNEHQQPQARDLQQASIPGSSKDRGTEKMASSASAADDDEKSRQQATVKKRRGRKSVVHSTPERDAETTRVSRERQRTSAHRTDKSITNPGPDGNETSQSQSNAAFMRHRRGRGQNSLSSRQAADDRNEQSSQHELDSSDISQQPKRRRGRPLPAQHATVSAAQTNESQASHEEASSESQSGRQESRSRGETVPITVHRLANVAALSQLPLSTTAESSDEDDRESLDELSTKEKTKFPSRGGVNPADVLSQICRETLEKAIATLSTGIANEANPARRTEFTRKKRAVQAFAAELEGRLFELSEILDSNFVLGVQCKKAKREMLDLRARLQQVRREREVIGLQLDAVRKKHADEENIKSVSQHPAFILFILFFFFFGSNCGFSTTAPAPSRHQSLPSQLGTRPRSQPRQAISRCREEP